jgi:hypothetical protein
MPRDQARRAASNGCHGREPVESEGHPLLSPEGGERSFRPMPPARNLPSQTLSHLRSPKPSEGGSPGNPPCIQRTRPPPRQRRNPDPGFSPHPTSALVQSERPRQRANRIASRFTRLDRCRKPTGRVSGQTTKHHPFAKLTTGIQHRCHSGARAPRRRRTKAREDAPQKIAPRRSERRERSPGNRPKPKTSPKLSEGGSQHTAQNPIPIPGSPVNQPTGTRNPDRHQPGIVPAA